MAQKMIARVVVHAAAVIAVVHVVVYSRKFDAVFLQSALFSMWAFARF